MISSIALLIIGALLLYLGADWLVKSGANIARKYKVTPFVIGLTVIAFGTSLPEFVISLNAALIGSSTIAIGNIIGSNIANIGLVFGISALIFPIAIHFNVIKRDLLLYLGICAIFILFTLNGRIDRIEGLLLFAGLILYTWVRIKYSDKKDGEDFQSTIKIGLTVILLMLGMFALFVGSKMFVSGAVHLSRLLGISEMVIGLTIVAIGTSLPELATSTVAAFKKESAISIGNIIGSNIFNILSVIGIVSIIKPITSPPELLKFEIPVMLAYGLVLIPLGLIKQPVNRINSLLMILGYIIFIFVLYT